MGKSLRSKPKLRAKSVKRKGEFTEFVDQRNKRLSEKAAEHLQKQREEALAKKQEKGEDIAEPKEEKKVENVSTSGWRGSHRSQYKKRKHKKNRTTRF